MSNIYRAAILAALLICFAGRATQAQSDPPPVTVDGFAYDYIERSQVHMNLCQAPRCVPGSRVSYTFLAPDGDRDFDQYKLEQERIMSALRAQAPEGETIVSGISERLDNNLFTSFSYAREHRTAQGTLFYKSSIVYTKNITISIISSSTDKEILDINANTFVAGLLAWSGSLEQNGAD